MLPQPSETERVLHLFVGNIDDYAIIQPEAALLDIGMPVMDGSLVAKQLREGAGAERLLLIAVTGRGQDEDRRMSKEAGFDHHLVKPVNPGILMPLIARHRAQAAGRDAGPQDLGKGP